MGIALSSGIRLPVLNGTAAERVAYGAMIEGDLWYETDNKLWYSYDGASWNLVSNTYISLLNSTTIANDTTESYTLSSIASGYKRFLIIITGKMVANNEIINIRFNSDSGNNYTLEGWEINGGAQSIRNFGSTSALNIFGNTQVCWTTTDFRSTTIEVTNQYSSGYKGYCIRGDSDDDSNFYASGTWKNAADEISRIDIFSNTGGRKWKTGTTISIWGFK